MRKIDLQSVPFSSKVFPPSQFRDVSQLSSFDKLTNGVGFETQKVRIFRKCLISTPMNDTTVSPFLVCTGIAQMWNYRRDYFVSCFSTLWGRSRSCLFWGVCGCLQSFLFSVVKVSSGTVINIGFNLI